MLREALGSAALNRKAHPMSLPLEAAGRTWLQSNRRAILRYAIAVALGVVIGFVLRGVL